MRVLRALVSSPLMSSRHRILEPYGRWHVTIYIRFSIQKLLYIQISEMFMLTNCLTLEFVNFPYQEIFLFNLLKWRFLQLNLFPHIKAMCCGQLWVRHMVCGQTWDGLYRFAFYLVNFGIPLGSHPIKSAQARHTGVQVPVVPAKRVTWSFFRSAPSTFPATWSTFKGPFRGVPSH